jgi:Toastrack DUF4097
MNNHNKLLLGTIAIVGIIGLAGSTLFARYSGPMHMGDLTSHGESDSEAAVENQSNRRLRWSVRSQTRDLGQLFFEQAFEDVDAVDVRMGDADVILEESRGNEVTVAFYVDGHGEEAWASDLFERMEFQAEESGSGLYVESRDPRVSRSEWRDHDRGFSSTVVIGVPMHIDLSVQTGDGDISAERITGRAALSSGDGDVLIRLAEGESLEVSTADGDIVIEGLSTAGARISTGDGDISLGDVRSALAVSTGDGDLRITFSESHEASISTGDGDVVLFVPATLRASFRLTGEDLNIAAGMELQGRLRDDMIQGDLNGGGPQIEVRTGDGSVTLRQKN